MLAAVAGFLVLNCSVLHAASPLVVIDDFSGNPSTNGWQIFGDGSLFAWNATNRNLEVTWDSSRPNSYFYKPLGRTLTRADDFTLDFELRLRDIAIGTTPGKPYTFQIAIGLLNLEQATNATFLRGTGADSPNLFEFDYFPDSGFGATISPTVISSNGEFATAFVIEELTTNDLFRVRMRMDESGQRVVFSLTRNGASFVAAPVSIGPNFTDFRVDALAVMSYSDAGQVPEYAGSILAHGVIDNISLSAGNAPRLDLKLAGEFEGGNFRVEFNTFAGWRYRVYRTTDFAAWTLVDSYTSTNSERATIVHENPPAQAQFYQIWSDRP